MNESFISAISSLLGVLTIIAQAGIGVALLHYAGLFKSPVLNTFITPVMKNARILAFMFALTATLGSLFYSEIAGYEPCKLCWYQRIFMYPHVILLGISILKNDNSINKYLYALSGIGAAIAGYHYFLQRTKIEILPCSAVGYSASCSNVFEMQFGYITIPLMALTAFVGIILFLRIHSRR